MVESDVSYLQRRLARLYSDHMVICEAPMKSIPVVEAKARFSALLAEVEAGEEIAVTRHGKVIARLVPDHPRKAADAFRDFWADADEIDLIAPDDKPAEGVASLDD
jgi:prevent-host-death family protein